MDRGGERRWRQGCVARWFAAEQQGRGCVGSQGPARGILPAAVDGSDPRGRAGDDPDLELAGVGHVAAAAGWEGDGGGR